MYFENIRYFLLATGGSFFGKPTAERSNIAGSLPEIEEAKFVSTHSSWRPGALAWSNESPAVSRPWSRPFDEPP